MFWNPSMFSQLPLCKYIQKGIVMLVHCKQMATWRCYCNKTVTFYCGMNRRPYIIKNREQKDTEHRKASQSIVWVLLNYISSIYIHISLCTIWNCAESWTISHCCYALSHVGALRMRCVMWTPLNMGIIAQIFRHSLCCIQMFTCKVTEIVIIAGHRVKMGMNVRLSVVSMSSHYCRIMTLLCQFLC